MSEGNIIDNDKKDKKFFIYFRHAEKLYSNGKAPYGLPQHDSPITGSSIPLIKRKSSELIEKFGIPEKIIMSPYLRIYQTVHELISILQDQTTMYENIFYDLNIAEYLGHQRGPIDLSKQTLETFDVSEFPQPGETLTELKKRVIDHLKIVHIDENNLSENNHKLVWVVTHGLVIKTIYDIIKKYNNCKKNNVDQFYPLELDYLIIQCNSDNTIELLFK